MAGMQFGIFSVGDVTPDPVNGGTPSEHERIKAMVAADPQSEFYMRATKSSPAQGARD